MKRMRMNSILLVVALPLAAAGADRDAGVTKDAEISAILSSVDSTRILDTATTLQNFRTRQSCSDQPEPGHGVTAARDFLFNQYSSISRASSKARPIYSFELPELANLQRDRVAARKGPESTGDHWRSLRFAHDGRH